MLLHNSEKPPAQQSMTQHSTAMLYPGIYRENNKIVALEAYLKLDKWADAFTSLNQPVCTAVIPIFAYTMRGEAQLRPVHNCA